jgi:hypothetical protein
MTDNLDGNDGDKKLSSVDRMIRLLDRVIDLISWGGRAGWDETARLSVLFMACGVPFALVSTWARQHLG